MSFLSLNITALSAQVKWPFEHDAAFYVAPQGEGTLAYVARICDLSYESAAENELILTLFDRLQQVSADSLFFRGVIGNLPNLDIRDGYDDDLCSNHKTIKRSLYGKVFDTLSAEKILILLDELQKRKLQLFIHEFIYLEEIVKQLPLTAARNAIEKQLLSRSSQPSFQLEKILNTLTEDVSIDTFDKVQALQVPAGELLIYTCCYQPKLAHVLSTLDQPRRKRLVTLGDIEHLHTFLQRNLSMYHQYEGILKTVASMLPYPTLLDFEFARKNDYRFEAICHLDAEVYQSWQAVQSRFTMLAEQTLMLFDEMEQVRYDHAWAQPIGNELQQEVIFRLVDTILKNLRFKNISEEELNNQLQAHKYSRCIYKHKTLYLCGMVVLCADGANLTSSLVTNPKVQQIFSTKCLAAVVSGNAFEEFPVPTSIYKKKSRSYWTKWNGNIGWEDKSHEDDAPSIKKYSTVIHPLIAGAASTILQASCSPSPLILEICAGAGRLADRIREKVPNEFRYILLERDLQAIQKGTKLLKGDDRMRCVQTDVVKEEEFFANPQKTEALQPESVDLCLGSGALTKCVLKTKRAACIVLEKIKRYLKPGGYLLLAGHADSWLTSDEFQTFGFTVLNTFCPSAQRPFYVLKKPL